MDSKAKRAKTSACEQKTDTSYDDDADAAKIKSIWSVVQTESDFDCACSTSVAIVHRQVEDMIRSGLDAFQRAEIATEELKRAHAEAVHKDAEIERLQAAEERSAKSIANLLRAVEESRTQAMDSSQTIKTEVGLRAEISFMTAKRDEAHGEAETYKRKVELLQMDLSDFKINLARISQEKSTMERMLAASQKPKPFATHSNDEFYKRKINTLSGRVQGLQSILAEKERQIQEMQNQMEKSMSINRWSNLESGRNRKRSL